jgi:cell division protein FtsW (lipid II flippase)
VDNWLRITEISMGLELFLGAILIMVVNRRLRSGRISKRTFHIQNLETLFLILIIAVIELFTIKYAFLRNRVLLIVIEIILVFVFLVVDRRFNGKESFTGGT